MTLFAAGSLGLIALSSVFLFLGWVNADARLIWSSIVATAVAVVLTALAYVRSRTELDRARRNAPRARPSQQAKQRKEKAVK